MFKKAFSFVFIASLSMAHAGGPDGEEKKTESSLKRYAVASLAGAGRGIVGLPLEHPFDCIKTRWQAHPEASSSFEVVKEIYNQKGLKGFYSGALPNGIRLAVKQAYRYPMMLFFPNLYNDYLPSSWEKEHPWVKKALTGGTIASLESLIITPLERLKVSLMTAGKDQSLMQFFSKNKGHLAPELFRGLNATYPKQLLSWVSFLVADEQVKNSLRHLKNDSKTTHYKDVDLSYPELLIASLAVGLINTGVILPWDCVKTQFQKQNPLENYGVMGGLKYVYRAHGMRGLYAGWQVRMAQYMIQSIFTVSLIEKLEKQWKK